MAHLFRKQITRYVGPDGKRCPKDAPDAKDRRINNCRRICSPDVLVRTKASGLQLSSLCRNG